MQKLKVDKTYGIVQGVLLGVVAEQLLAIAHAAGAALVQLGGAHGAAAAATGALLPTPHRHTLPTISLELNDKENFLVHACIAWYGLPALLTETNH